MIIYLKYLTMYKLKLLSTFISLTIKPSGQDMFALRQLTFDPARKYFATRLPDGKIIAFTISRVGILLMDVNVKKIRKDLKNNY